MQVVRNEASNLTNIKDVYIVASTNTDIPTYYSKWFFENITKGSVRLFAYNQPAEEILVSLLPEDVRGYIFYSKNYAPFLKICQPLIGKRVKFFFTIGDSSVFQVKVPSFDKLFEQLDILISLFGTDAIIWKLPPVFFNRNGDILFMENLDMIAQGMVKRGVTRGMIELFSSRFHPEEITNRLRENGVVDFIENENLLSLSSLAVMIGKLKTLYNIEIIGGDYKLFDDLKLSDIEDRVNTFDIGRMHMPCPTKCLYCDTNFTVNYENDGSKRTQIKTTPSCLSLGLEKYFRSIGLEVESEVPERINVSPYAIELRTVQKINVESVHTNAVRAADQQQVELINLMINLVGDGEGINRGYILNK